MNVEMGTESPIFLFWEYLFLIFGILSLQCFYLHLGLWTNFGFLLDNLGPDII